MIGHLGPRVSALLDGQLPPAEAEEAWAHVYACHRCRDQVEREGWIKTRLAGLAAPEDCGTTPATLKGSLMNLTPRESLLPPSAAGATTVRRHVPAGITLIGGGALGAALLGVVALGITPGSGGADRRPPVTQINQSNSPSPSPAPGRTGGPSTGAPTPVRNATTRLPAPVDRFFG